MNGGFLTQPTLSKALCLWGGSALSCAIGFAFACMEFFTIRHLRRRFDAFGDYLRTRWGRSGALPLGDGA